jgi:hypothetical protein
MDRGTAALLITSELNIAKINQKPPLVLPLQDDVRMIILDYNKKDKLMMEKLSEAIEKINAFHVIRPQGKKMEFSFERPLS